MKPELKALLNLSNRRERTQAHESGHFIDRAREFDPFPKDVEIVLFQAHITPQTREEAQLIELRRELALIAHSAKFDSEGKA